MPMVVYMGQGGGYTTDHGRERAMGWVLCLYRRRHHASAGYGGVAGRGCAQTPEIINEECEEAQNEM